MRAMAETSRRISARAEEPCLPRPATRHLKAHLRASGGTQAIPRSARQQKGASPRERRNLCNIRANRASKRRISARAEEPKAVELGLIEEKAHLRASGGTRLYRYSPIAGNGASPRERRNQVHAERLIRAVGRISARAEEPLIGADEMNIEEAHLRASGGTDVLVSPTVPVKGRISARAEEP